MMNVRGEARLESEWGRVEQILLKVLLVVSLFGKMEEREELGGRRG